jgi:cyclic pyranopterin phosphate synthase
MSSIFAPVRVVSGPLDTLGRRLVDLRISVLDRCNFRCPYCMPADRFAEGHRFLAPAARMSLTEMLTMIDCFVGMGVRKLRITGGEPLLYRDLLPLITQVHQHWPQLDIALTTNGTRLRELAQPLRAAGLGRITISLDALNPDLFLQLSGGRGSVKDVLEAIEHARAAGFESVKLNCVVQRSTNLLEILPLIRYFRHSGCVLRFIEYMDVGTVNGWQHTDVVSAAELRTLIENEFMLRALPRHAASDVAQRWALADGSLELGFITSVSEPFCGDCSRARLSADGQFHTCLFSTQGHDLLGVLRADPNPATLRTQIQTIWSERDDRYSELRGTAQANRLKSEMYHLGG